jgi:hypothetical protein
MLHNPLYTLSPQNHRTLLTEEHKQYLKRSAQTFLQEELQYHKVRERLHLNADVGTSHNANRLLPPVPTSWRHLYPTDY